MLTVSFSYSLQCCKPVYNGAEEKNLRVDKVGFRRKESPFLFYRYVKPQRIPYKLIIKSFGFNQGPWLYFFFRAQLISIKISRNSAFSDSDKPRMLFFLLINVKMPTIVGILTFMSGKKIHAQLSWAWKKFYNLGASLWVILSDLPALHIDNPHKKQFIP